ncbi:DHHA1 domain protein [Methanobrevibacter curvatus]|uniref:DHHA1 domain protein n=1 Tax=Methanobrevibacter curvatus TaxID=49547 RepID=A0A165Z739_9EURY|nr:DHHA1 domain protein [Methanobrevibacter curvatus]
MVNEKTDNITQIITEIPKSMGDLYKKAKEIIETSKNIKIYSHNDCDGISAGAILSILLDRLGKEHEIEIISLDKLENLKITHELTIFSDLASGQNIDKNAHDDSKFIILDHHPPIRDINYNDNVNYSFLEINSNHHGIDGSHYVCGGGLSYLLAREFGFKDLSWIGVLAAVGDMQNGRSGKLEGLNSLILNDAVDQGYVDIISDLSLYGRQTRPLFVALSFFSDVILPITNNKREAIALLEKLDIPVKNQYGSRTLSDLTNIEKKKLFSTIMAMLSKSVPGKYVKYIPRLVSADSYEFLMEENKTFLRDASEFSTAMNACTRNNREDIALRILKGDRLEALDELEVVSKVHKQYLAQNIQRIQDQKLIVQDENIQYFNGEGIKSSVVGTVAGMILSYGDWKKPIIGFTRVSDENKDWKVSLRCSRLLAFDGIHFGNIIRDISQKIGGNGGGHSVACGAYIPYEKKDDFLSLLNQKLEGLISK